MKTRVGVFFGGRSVEHEISVISALQAIHAMDRDRYEVIPVYIAKDGIWYTGDPLLEVDNYQNLEQLLGNCRKVFFTPFYRDHSLHLQPRPRFRSDVFAQIDVAFPILHGTYGEDGAIQGLFELLGIPYVGCEVLAAGLSMDKVVMKMVLQAHSLPVVEGLWFQTRDWIRDREELVKLIESELGYPVIIKPANLGSSVGISKAADRDELEEAVDLAGRYAHKLLVEKLISNLREINCSVLGDTEKAEASVCEEPVRSGTFLSYQDKYVSKGGSKQSKGMSGARRQVPADIPDELNTRIQDLARRSFTALECRGVARIDFLLDEDSGEVFVNELNTIPGSLSFYLWEASGKPFPALLDELIALAFKAEREKSELTLSYDDINIFSLGSGGFKSQKN